MAGSMDFMEGPFSGGQMLEKNYEPHYTAWKANPTPENAGNLLRAVDPIIDKAMKSYARGSKDSPTLRSKAKQITLNAFNNYDPTKSKLQTYLYYQLQSLQRATAKEERIISAPEQILLDSKHLYDSSNELKDSLGRDPSDSELADHVGLSLKRIKYIRRLKQAVPESTFTTQRGSEDEMFDPAVQMHDDSGWREFVYHDLDPTNQIIMEHLLGMHGKAKLPTKLIAQKLGVSPGAISQRSASIQAKLDKRDELGVI